ncbi:Fungal specific transcription factor domain [Teratosphaeria destructans]|uniref:Fungal specific transcription factor domain n=1 Tax=Teratosphaeria destructans TaxID=418781 RepID=A0A9W7VZY7_9PEZI|nr:Fungal specific transcription factor domain [Teratosphaeria destructans]
MAQPTSDRACNRCRERRVKCDKTQPACRRCEKLGKPCSGYDKKRKFVDEGVSLRRKFQHSTEQTGSGPSSQFIRPDLGTFTTQSGQRNQSAAPSPFASILNPPTEYPRQDLQQDPYLPDAPSYARPKLGSIGNVVRASPTLAGPLEASGLASTPGVPCVDNIADPTLFPETNYAIQAFSGGGTSVDVWDESTFDPAWFDLDPQAYYAQNNNSCGFIPNAHIIDEVDRAEFQKNTDPCTTPDLSTALTSFPESSLWASESQLHTSALITDDREHEMAYLIRHFTESIGPWMDLFDRDKHFEHLVPLKALRDALLRNAVAAVAAKQLGRTRGHKLFVGNQSQKPAHMEVLEDAGVDWFYKAANYYDKAIASSREYLQAVSGSLSRPPSPNDGRTISTANSDDLLVAVSIFSLYESLDNVELGWIQHLAGLKSLLTAVGANQQEQYQIVPAVTVGRQASFWNFARADYQAAYTHRRKTLLDTSDLKLWRESGLEIQPDGTLYADAIKIKNDTMHCRKISELCARTLLWIVLRITNFVAAEDVDRDSDAQMQTWQELTGLLEYWHTNLPETFQPCAAIRFPLRLRTHRGTSGQLTEVFFSITVCAAALQLYHFARIVLLHNKPGPTNATVNRFKAYREVSAEAIKHARQIVGIALGRPPPSVRVEMSLSLYVAGGCLEDDDERKVVLELLRAIEKDTGCANEDKVRNLVTEWGWKQEPEAID